MSEDKKAAVRAVETGERKDRVLIVEDEENARKGYEALLQRWGHEVMGVGSAEDALARFAGFQPDILIADVELPGKLARRDSGRSSNRHYGARNQREKNRGD
jgi:CheY-like chemotaxis protein